MKRLKRQIINRIRPFPLSEVSVHRQEAEVDPRRVGLTPDVVRHIWASLEAFYETGLYPAVALCLRRRGEVVIDGTIGHARGNGPQARPDTEPVLATPETLFNIFSASKAVTAMLIHLLDDRGLVHLDDTVTEYIPEFGARGKGWVTLRHVLTHRAGIPSVPGVAPSVELLEDWDTIIQMLCAAEPVMTPGRRLAYHALTGGFILGEVIRRETGKDIRAFLQEAVLDPLGFQHHNYGVSVDELERVAEHAFTGPAPFPPMTWIMKRAIGVPYLDAIRLSNHPTFLTHIVPSGNIVATADEACRFYQLLLNGGALDGVRIFDRRTVKRATAEQTYLEMDFSIGLPVRYGMGFVLGTENFSLYGHSSAQAFGHIGLSNVVIWADPERDIAVALMSTGKPLVHGGLLKWFDVMGTIARCVPRDGRQTM